MIRIVCLGVCGWCVLSAAVASEEAAIEREIDAILAVENEGRGNEQAGEAWQQIARRDAYAIPTLLASLDGANPLAANYLRSAVDAISERSIAENSPLPADELEAFLGQTAHEPKARRLAYELLVKVDPSASERWIPNLLHDPSPEFRRDAVDYWYHQAEAKFASNDREAALPLYEKALSGAVEEDQVKQIAKRLKELGRDVDLPRHFGLIQNWMVIGSFDNTGQAGFDVAYPPEASVDFDAEHPGKTGTVQWKELVTKHPMADVDLIKGIEEAKGVIAYAATNFHADEATKAQIRFGTPNGWKLWVNGQLIFARDEYHSGENFDQYQFDVDLKKGDNLILFKCCQNEQTESWTNRWGFSMRVCDPSGTAILASNRPSVAADPPSENEEED